MQQRPVICCRPLAYSEPMGRDGDEIWKNPGGGRAFVLCRADFRGRCGSRRGQIRLVARVWHSHPGPVSVLCGQFAAQPDRRAGRAGPRLCAAHVAAVWPARRRGRGAGARADRRISGRRGGSRRPAPGRPSGHLPKPAVCSVSATTPARPLLWASAAPGCWAR